MRNRTRSRLSNGSMWMSVAASLNVFIHVVDLFIFSWASLSASFYHSYDLLQIVGALAWDAVGILFILFPAASVSAAGTACSRL